MAAPEFDPATGRMGDVRPLARPERKRRNGQRDLPVEKPPRLQVLTEQGTLVPVGDNPVYKDELIARLAAKADAETHRADTAEAALRDAERELVQYRAKVRRLENDKQRDRMEYVKRAEVEHAMDHWRQIAVDCGWSSRKNCKLTKDRFDSIRSAIEDGASVRLIDHASLYIMRYPFVSKQGRQPHGRPEDRYDDIELVCRNGSKLEKWAQLGAGIVRREGYVFPWDREEAKG